MAFPIEAWQTALEAARQGLSANAGLRTLRDAGVGIRRDTWLTLYRSASTVIARSAGEPFAPLHSKPQSHEIGEYPSKSQTGYMQRVTLVYRERGTGNIIRTYHSTMGNRLVTRQQAIQNAVNAYAGEEDEYDQELIGVSYTSTVRFVPLEGA